MREIKPKAVFIHIGASLLYMASKRFAQSFLQKMRRAVVFANRQTLFFIYGKFHDIPYFYHSFFHCSDMSDFAA